MVSLTSAAVVSAVAFGVPLLLRLTRQRLPEVVLLIVVGIIVGPQVLRWAQPDEPVKVLSTIGLAFLLLLAGTEIDARTLRGPAVRPVAIAYLMSAVLAVGVGLVLAGVGLVGSAVLIAIILASTSLGILLPVLQDSGHTETSFGRLVITGGSVAEVVPIVALSVLFSVHSRGLLAKVLLALAFLVFVAAVTLALREAERARRLSAGLLALQDTTAQIRVRGVMLLLLAFACVADAFGLEAILGAFLAGAALRIVDRDEGMTHAPFMSKLRAVGFGAFIPFFFVQTGMSLDVRALFGSPAVLARVPLFLLALVVVRALPALWYRSALQGRLQVVAAGLLQATSLNFPVVAGSLGVQLGLLRAENYVALVAAGLVSVVLFPLTALALLGRQRRQ